MAIGPSQVITIGVSLLVLAIVFPIAMGEIITGYNSSWNSAVSTIFATLLPILVIIGAALYFLPRIGK